MRVEGKKFVIYNLTGPQFSGKSFFRGKYIATKIYANLGSALMGFEQMDKGD